MPTYEYKCTQCGHRFERFQNMTDRPVRVCPECGGPTERLISGGGGIIFKGSGFYETDYKNKGAAKTRCGKGSTCCGRDEPCTTPPCKE